MDILNMARDSGMLITLDARIGHEEYHSVYGSLQALQRFADAIRESLRFKTDDDETYCERVV